MTFADRIASALDTDDATEAGARVHTVVVDEMRSLDPTVKPEITGYFNHSYIPDLVVSWADGSRSGERPVYLRHSLRSSRASGDLENLTRADRMPFILSLALDEPEDDTQTAREAVVEHRENRTLITTVPALDELTKPTDAPDPVLGVVKASVVRSAKGLIVENDVEKLVLPRERRIEEDDLNSFTAAVDANFTEDAVVRINRVFGIVEQALARDPNGGELLTSGTLTFTEIRELVPYLLRMEGVTRSRDFWLGVARLISLEEIERLWGDLSDLDLTPLASAGSSLWRATRAQLSVRAETIDDPDADDSARWAVNGRTLSAEVGAWRISYAFTPTKMKTKGRELSPARWPDLRPSLQPYIVTAVDLSGVVTQSQYGAQETVDMKTRIDNFIVSADDSFHVPSVTLLTGVGDDSARVTANFTEMMLTASPTASIETMTRVALDVLGYRRPTAAEAVEELLRGDSRVGEEEPNSIGSDADDAGRTD